MDIWINCVGLTVRTGTAAVGCVANGVGMLGLAKKLGQSWAKVGPKLGQDLVEGLARVGTES